MDRYDLKLKLPEFYRSVPFGELERVLGDALSKAGADLDLTLEQLWPAIRQRMGASIVGERLWHPHRHYKGRGISAHQDNL